jgi:hypothetical protein
VQPCQTAPPPPPKKYEHAGNMTLWHIQIFARSVCTPMWEYQCKNLIPINMAHHKMTRVEQLIFPLKIWNFCNATRQTSCAAIQTQWILSLILLSYNICCIFMATLPVLSSCVTLFNFRGMACRCDLHFSLLTNSWVLCLRCVSFKVMSTSDYCTPNILL